MSLQQQVMDAMKIAMKAKDTQALEALRAVKSALLIAQTATGSKEEISEEEELKILQKQVFVQKVQMKLQVHLYYILQETIISMMIISILLL